MKLLNPFLIGCSSLFIACHASAEVRLFKKPVAWVYYGPGVCNGCPDDLQTALEKVGFKVKKAYPGDFTLSNLLNVDVVAVPGGDEESDVMHALLPGEASTIRAFVKKGGHYLGVCLGAFLAAPHLIDTQKTDASGKGSFEEGLNLFDGNVHNHAPTKAARMERVTWQSTPIWMYFQDGPDFTLNHPEKADIWAYYSPREGEFDQKIAAFQAPLSSGKVGLIGPHLEATQEWLDDDHISIENGTIKYEEPLQQFGEFMQALIH